MPPPRRPTAMGPVPAPAGQSPVSTRDDPFEDEEERTTVDAGPPSLPALDRADALEQASPERWEEATRREGAQDRTPLPRRPAPKRPPAPPAPKRRAAVGARPKPAPRFKPVESDDEDEVTVRASKMQRRNAGIDVGPQDGASQDEDEVTVNSGDGLATGTGERTIDSQTDGQSNGQTMDELTVDEQPKPLPPLSVAPPIPAGKRGRTQPRPSVASGRLMVVAGNDTGREFDLLGKTVIVGRGVDCDLVLTDIAVSRRHMAMEFDGRFYRVRDLGSGNGTLLNDRIEDGLCELRHGDRVEIGNTVFRFEHPGSKASHAAVGWGNQADADEDVSTVAGRSGKKPVLPPPNGSRAESNRKLVLPPRPPGAGPVASAPNQAIGAGMGLPVAPTLPLGQSRPLADPALAPGGPLSVESAQPLRPDYSQELPQMAAAMSLPMNAQHDLLLPKSGNKIIIGVISATLGIVVIAIMATLFGGDEAQEAPAVVAEALPIEASGAGDTAPKGVKPATAARAMPLGTWGTNEVLLASRAGLPTLPAAGTDDGTDASDATPVVPKDDEPTKAAPEANQGEQAPDTTDTAPLPKAATESGKTSKTSKTARQPTPKLSKRRPQRKSKATTRKKSKRSVRTAAATRSRKSVAAARRRATSMYKRKDFNGAAEALRSAAEKADGPSGGKLRTLATNYETIGVNLTRAQSSQSRKPTSAMSAYRRALSLDKRVGGGAHAAYIRIKLGQTAPKAAASYMAKKKYEAAKKVADSAVNYGAGGSPTVRRVRAALERKAAEFYKWALGKRKSNPAASKKTLRRILKMVPPDSPYYAKAYKLLNKRRKARDDDE